MLLNASVTSQPTTSAIPLAVKIPYTAFVIVIVPFYVHHYGWLVFLWTSDVTRFGTLLALWLESNLLVSMMTVCFLPVSLAWMLDFLATFVLGFSPLHIAHYMFDADRSLFLRGLSLDHVWLPVLLIWSVWRLGYNRHAWAAQCILFAVLLVATYLLVDNPYTPAGDVNWTFSRLTISRESWLLVVLTFMSFILFLPTHLVMTRVFPSNTMRRGDLSASEKHDDFGDTRSRQFDAVWRQAVVVKRKRTKN